MGGAMTPHRLGSWSLPSGDSCDVDLVEPVEGIGELRFWWDLGPPFVPGDEAYYRIVVLPAVTKRVREYPEKIGRVLVLTL
jgi:hypothetical protein